MGQKEAGAKKRLGRREQIGYNWTNTAPLLSSLSFCFHIKAKFEMVFTSKTVSSKICSNVNNFT